MRALSLATLAFFVALAAPSLARAQDAAPVSSASYDLALWNGSPFIDLTIDGARGRFLFDTGANVSGVDRQWLATSGIAWTPGAISSLGGTTGAFSTASAVVDRLDLGRGFFTNASFLLENFSGFALVGGQPQAGLLGMDFIADYCVTLDLDAGKATLLLPWETPAPAPDEYGLALTLDKNVPTLEASLGGLSLPCRLDTGDAYLDDRPLLDVNHATVAALEAQGYVFEGAGSIVVSGVSGPETLTLLAASDATPLALDLGAARVSGIVLVVHDQGTLAIDTPVALAGARVIAKLGAIRLDFPTHTLWLHNVFD